VKLKRFSDEKSILRHFMLRKKGKFEIPKFEIPMGEDEKMRRSSEGKAGRKLRK
jgi:hypothetical protein